MCAKSMTSVEYVKLLAKPLPATYQQCSRENGEVWFQHDNAPIHKAHHTLDFFEENGIVVEEHLPYSPDLNPIEHIRVELKQCLHEQYPTFSETKGGRKAVKAKLAEVLPLVWDTIPEELFEKLWRSIPDRVAAVIEAEGWYTKY